MITDNKYQLILIDSNNVLDLLNLYKTLPNREDRQMVLPVKDEMIFCKRSFSI